MKKAICILLVWVMLCLCGCQSHTQETFFAMDTVMDLQIWGVDSKKAVQTVRYLVTDLDSGWSAHKDNSKIAAINKGAQAEEPFLEEVKALSRRTNGAFDPQLYAVMQLWGFGEETHSVPTQEQIAQAREQKLWDLGGAVKGYAGHLAVERLQQLDVDRAMLNLGGNVQTYGTKPDGSPWSIGIQNPNGGDPVGVVSVTGTMAVVTSGDYQRYFEKDGVRYHHILDPETGYPARSGLRSVTVISRDGLKADVFSTALFVMGLEKATQFWQESDDFEAVFITAEGKIYATQGAALSGCEYEVIHREN